MRHASCFSLFPLACSLSLVPAFLTLVPDPWSLRKHQPVQAPQKRRQRLARPRWRQNQRALPARNHRPAHPLRRCRRIKHRLEPRRRYRMKTSKRIGSSYSFTICIRDFQFSAHSVLSIPRSEAKKKRKVDLDISSSIDLHSTQENQEPTLISGIICSCQNPLSAED